MNLTLFRDLNIYVLRFDDVVDVQLVLIKDIIIFPNS